MNVQSPALLVQPRPDARPADAGGVPTGATIGCPVCGVRGVVLSAGTGREQVMCHAALEPVRPVRCTDVRPRRGDDLMVAGGLYRDDFSGFWLRCTRGGPGQMTVDGRALRRDLSLMVTEGAGNAH